MKEIIANIIKEKTEGTGLFFVDASVRGNKIDVFIDGDTGITINDCATVNRYLHTRLEEKGIDSGKYIIEVSSPGFDRPLEQLREYKKNVGRKMIIRNTQNKFIKGVLAYADDKKIIISNKQKQDNNKAETIPFAAIKEAKVTI